ncbi:mitotic spindle assembly checkpoint protein MAD2A [Centruroides vittatus]|uniref:mitotic spindle assembly checkpoint protein MAD2A n=1 Tax=Centruroides vittatus TaxID=120091 RepID=UPI003510AF54
MAATVNETTITLKGSADIVAEFFNYGINSILYQRGIYPPETFTQSQKYGLTILMTDDKDLKEFLSNILKQVHDWLLSKELYRVSIVITDNNTLETLECWEFKIESDDALTKDGKPKQKDIKEIQKEIRDIIRQITASITFLPLLDSPCSFDIHLYTHKNTKVPDKWADTVPGEIANSQRVRLRSFSTTVHKVDACVFYRGCE